MCPLGLDERTLPAEHEQVRVIARNETTGANDGSTIKVAHPKFELAAYRTSLRNDPAIYKA